jgi:site-specific DNA-methyltransferase (adenine-specific)
MALMARYPDKYFDLAVVDPPYGIDAGKMTMGSGKHKFKKGKDWDAAIPNQYYFLELFRVSKNQIIWGGNYFTNILTPSNDWIIWDKLNPNLSFSEAELAWCSIKRNTRIFKHYSAQVEDGGKIHPTQKAVRLYDWIFKNYAQEGQKILDTHLGSGSSRISAWKAKLNFVGCELDTDYFGAQEKRFAEFRKQLTMF